MPSIVNSLFQQTFHNSTRDKALSPSGMDFNISFQSDLATDVLSDTNMTFDTDHVSNHSFYITDSPGYPVVQNTPLTVPEMDLVTVKNDDFLHKLLGSSSDTEELYWVIPVVIATVGVFVILALLMFYCIRKLELKMMDCCRRNCFWCCCYSSEEDTERMVLRSENLAADTELREYRSYSLTTPQID